MPPRIFRYIRMFSLRQQFAVIVLTLVSFPFLYVSLQLPKTIINEAIAGDGSAVDVLGFEFEQIPYLLLLCGAFLALVFVNGGFKFQINVYKGVMAERLLRRLRYMLVERVIRFPLSQFRVTSQGELVAMITAEVEPLGGFFGDAIALPIFQGGTFLTIVVFVFMQDPWLGLAAVSLIPIQGYVIPKLQRRVNMLGKERVRNVRSLSDRVGELVSGISEVRGHDTSGYILADFSQRLGKIYDIRFDIYKRKFFIKFLNNFLNQLTPFFFFSIGGYLVIIENLTFGALVAALAAYKDLSAPWKELLSYYQRMADASIKYEDLVSQFQPAGMTDPEIMYNRPEELPALAGPVNMNGVSLVDENGIKTVDNASLALEPGSRVALIGPGGSGKEQIARLLARLALPTSGKITIGGEDLASLPEAAVGARIAYTSAESYLFNGTIFDNLIFGLLHDVAEESEMSSLRRAQYDEALASGNNPANFDLDWIDYGGAGAAGPDEFMQRLTRVVAAVELEDGFFRMGLRQTIDPEGNSDLAQGILWARLRIQDDLAQRGMTDLVRQYDPESFNPYVSVAENILFGVSRDPSFAVDEMAANPVITELLGDEQLLDRFEETGRRVAETMVELFANLHSGDPLFERYSFLDEDALDDLQIVVRRLGSGETKEASEADREVLRSLAMKLVPQRHQLGLIDDTFQEAVLRLRLRLRQVIDEEVADRTEARVTFFDRAAYSSGLTIEGNILFGSVAHGRPDAPEEVGGVIDAIMDDLGLRQAVVQAALDIPSGIAGGRLTPAVRQKIALARAALKQPRLLIIDEALTALDGASRARLLTSLGGLLPEGTILWIDSELPAEMAFDRVMNVRAGRVEDLEAVPAERAEEIPGEAEGDNLAAMATRLMRVPMLAGLEHSQLKLLAFTSDTLTYDVGERIIQQGDTGDCAYVITGGEAKIVVERDGQERFIRTCGENEILGELALLNDIPRTASIEAVTELTVLRMSKDVFLELLKANNHAAHAVMREIAQRLASMT